MSENQKIKLMRKIKMTMKDELDEQPRYAKEEQLNDEQNKKDFEQDERWMCG